MSQERGLEVGRQVQDVECLQQAVSTCAVSFHVDTVASLEDQDVGTKLGITGNSSDRPGLQHKILLCCNQAGSQLRDCSMVLPLLPSHMACMWL